MRAFIWERFTISIIRFFLWNDKPHENLLGINKTFFYGFQAYWFLIPWLHKANLLHNKLHSSICLSFSLFQTIYPVIWNSWGYYYLIWITLLFSGISLCWFCSVELSVLYSCSFSSKGKFPSQSLVEFFFCRWKFSYFSVDSWYCGSHCSKISYHFCCKKHSKIKWVR